MAERERTVTPLAGAFSLPGAQVMDADDLRRAVTRIAHEIVERNHGLDDVVLVGLQTGGVPLVGAWPRSSSRIEGVDVPVGTLDVAFYRDDIGLRPVLPEAVTDIPVDLTGTTWCWSTTCCSPAARCGPRSTRSPTTAGPGRCSSR